MTGRGHDVHVLATRPSKGKSYSEFRDEAHRAPRALPLRAHARELPDHLPLEIKKEIALLFDRVKPDVVHIQSHYMIGELTYLYEAVRRGVRIVATNHFMPENLNPFLPFPQWFKDIVGRVSWRDMGKVMGQADVVTTPTPLAAKAMHDHAFLRKVLPLSNGIDAAAYELKPGRKFPSTPAPPCSSWAASPRKMHIRRSDRRHLQDACPPRRPPAGGRRRRGPTGPGGPGQAPGLGDRVRFLGLASDEELRRAYLGADLFLHAGHRGAAVPGDP